MKTLEEIVTQAVRQRGKLKPGVGLCVGVFKEGEPEVFAFGDGIGGGRPGGGSFFEIGSVTKVFTATLLADMVRANLVKLDDPVQTLLPMDVRLTEPKMTLLHLATHTSGLPRLPGNLGRSAKNPENPYAHYGEPELFAFLNGHKLERGWFGRYRYSNLGVGLLGHLLARKLGLSYEQAICQRICAPLDLQDTVITLADAQRARLMPPRTAGGAAATNWDFQALAGAGALRSTPDDLLRFLAANLGYTEQPLKLALQDCHYSHLKDFGQEVGLCWHLYPFANNKWNVWHNGATGGYQSYVGFEKERSVAVAVLVNCGPSLLGSLFGGLADKVGGKILGDLTGK